MVCSFLLPSDSSRLRAVATSSDGGLEGFKAYPVFKEMESLLREVKQQSAGAVAWCSDLDGCLIVIPWSHYICFSLLPNAPFL